MHGTVCSVVCTVLRTTLCRLYAVRDVPHAPTYFKLYFRSYLLRCVMSCVSSRVVKDTVAGFHGEFGGRLPASFGGLVFSFSLHETHRSEPPLDGARYTRQLFRWHRCRCQSSRSNGSHPSKTADRTAGEKGRGTTTTTTRKRLRTEETSSSQTMSAQQMTKAA